MSLDQVLQTFIAESRELLADMEKALLQIRETSARGETVNAIFRAAHTIKGSAGLFNLDHIVAFTHDLESVLDGVRNDRVALSEELISLLLLCSDHIGVLIDGVASGHLESDEALARAGAPLVDKLRGHLAPTEAPAPPPSRWHISLRFGKEVLRNGMDPLSFLRYLGTIGEIAGIVTLPDALPPPAEMDPEACYLGFEIAFDSPADRAAIEGAFDFVRDDCKIAILPPGSPVADFARLIDGLSEDKVRLAEVLVRCGSIAPNALPAGGTKVAAAAAEPAALPAVAVAVKEHRAQEKSTIRVDADKLDHLINLVGELIIAAAGTNLIARRAHIVELQECTSTLSSLVQEVRDSALQLRMVKIGATFNRFQRVVHDVAKELGKDIGLVVSGEDTELDKTVVEKIADPLMHLVRNAIDHGIESAEVRAARGKPARGTVTLNAFHDSGSIVIEVSDDGGGLKRDKIVAKAVERGLIEAGRALSDSAAFSLIFEPGFSTADAITNLSGRGVGLDVVKRNITALRGSVDLKSVEGAGTTVTVRMPLTLASINGFLVGLGTSTYVIPLDMIEECVEFSSEPGHDYTNLRGKVLPFIRLRDVFAADGAAGRRQNIVVVTHAGHRAGLVVDALLGEFQTVIKPLAKMFNQVTCVSGSTILGSGEVALILDVPALLRRTRHEEIQQSSKGASA